MKIVTGLTQRNQTVNFRCLCLITAHYWHSAALVERWY
jgi:hypothetical protein